MTVPFIYHNSNLHIYRWMYKYIYIYIYILAYISEHTTVGSYSSLRLMGNGIV